MAFELSKARNPLLMHQFAVSYNCNDGCIPYYGIVHNDSADLGTLLLIYWLHLELLYIEREEPRCPSPDFDAREVLEIVERRVKDKSYASTAYSFDVDGLWPGGTESVRQMWNRGELRSAKCMLEPCMGKEVPPPNLSESEFKNIDTRAFPEIEDPKEYWLSRINKFLMKNKKLLALDGSVRSVGFSMPSVSVSIFPEDALQVDESEFFSIIRSEQPQDSHVLEWRKVEMVEVHSQQVTYFETNWKELIANRTTA